MKKITLIILLLFSATFLFSQDYISSIEQYNVDNGLSHNQINWIHKDRKGMMWIGTFNGINRYDGQDFKYVAEVDFTHVHNEKILEDEEGDLWLIKNRPKNELFFFNTITEKVKTFEEKFGTNPPFRSEEFLLAKMISNNSVAVFTTTGTHLINSDRALTKQEEMQLLGWHYPNSNQYWVQHPNVNQYFIPHLNSNQITYTNENTGEHQVFEKIPPAGKSLAVSSKNHFFYQGMDAHIHELTPSGQVKKHDLNSKEIDALRLSTFYYSNQKTEGFTQITQGNFRIYEIENLDSPRYTKYFPELAVTEISAYYRDENNHWIGTINGLYKVQAKLNYFKKGLYKDPTLNTQIDFHSCRGMVEDDDGNVFVTTNNVLLNVKDGTTFNPKWTHYSFHNVAMVDDGILWTNDGGINHQCNIYTNHAKVFATEGVTHSEVWSFFQDSTGRVWGGTTLGLTYYEEGFSKFKHYKKYNEFDELRTDIIYQFFTDKDDVVWLVSSGGLYQLDLEKGVVARYWTGGEGEYKFPANRLQHIYQDDDGIFWIASRRGLIRWDKEKSETRLFNNDDGFSNSNLNALFESPVNERDGFIWMSSDNGIIQFQKSTFKVKNYLMADGITHPEFNRISHYQAKDGTIYFGGLNGVTYFHPRDFVESFEEPIDIPLVLTEYKIFSEESESQEDRKTEFFENKKITLSPGDRYLTLQFALLDYNNLNASQYVFEIDGEKWKATKENSINISSLPYGEHTLTVKGRTGGGLFSTQTLSIPIEVLKPFYLQWWFIALGVSGLAFLVFIFQKRKTQQLVKRKEELENTVQERTQTIQLQAEELRLLNQSKSKFMANISHEFRTPLTLILNTISREKLNNTNGSKIFTFVKKDMDIMERNAHRLQQLIEQLLDLSKMEAGKMSLRASQNDFYQYLKFLVLSFQPMAEDKQITLNFISNLRSCDLYFDRDKMDKIVYNLLGNAIKFTPQMGNVNVLLEKQDGKIIFQIKDSGIGIPSKELPFIFDRFYRGELKDEYAYEGTGLGLALVKEFVEIHKGNIQVESTVGEGTQFIINLPTGAAHLEENEITTSENKNILKPHTVGSNILEKTSKLTHTLEQPILLVIEDNEDLLYHHQQSFQNDFQLLLAKDGVEGVAMAIEHLPDVIICDVMMPKKNGYEVCQHLKLDERTNHIPIILLTAKADHSEKMEGLMVGADAYLTKPYNQVELEIRLKNLIEGQNLIQEKLLTQISNPKEEEIVKTPQQIFIDRCNEIIATNLTNPTFNVEEWSNELGMSRSQLFRKMKAVIGVTPTQFIRTYRLEKAKNLLSQNAGNGSEVSYMVGFNNPNYFFKCFKDEYGITVGDFIRN